MGYRIGIFQVTLTSTAKRQRRSFGLTRPNGSKRPERGGTNAKTRVWVGIGTRRVPISRDTLYRLWVLRPTRTWRRDGTLTTKSTLPTGMTEGKRYCGIYLDRELHRAVKLEAVMRETTLSAIVERALRRYLRIKGPTASRLAAEERVP